MLGVCALGLGGIASSLTVSTSDCRFLKPLKAARPLAVGPLRIETERMKKLTFAFALGWVVWSGIETASACSPPPPAFSQQDRLNQVLDSEEFGTALEAQVRSQPSVAIETIGFSDAVDFRLSSGCVIKGFVEYERPEHPGLCPGFKVVRVETFCN